MKCCNMKPGQVDLDLGCVADNPPRSQIDQDWTLKLRGDSYER